MSRNGIYSFIYFFVYLFVQVLILKKLVLFNTSFCFLYVAFILLLPIELNNLILMLAAFLLGFGVDIFYDSLGIHALSLVAVAYARNYWLNSITPQGGYDAGEGPTLAVNASFLYMIAATVVTFCSTYSLSIVDG